MACDTGARKIHEQQQPRATEEGDGREGILNEPNSSMGTQRELGGFGDQRDTSRPSPHDRLFHGRHYLLTRCPRWKRRHGAPQPLYHPSVSSLVPSMNVRDFHSAKRTVYPFALLPSALDLRMQCRTRAFRLACRTRYTTRDLDISFASRVGAQMCADYCALPLHTFS